MKNKKGLIGLLMILLVVAGIVGGAYVYFLITQIFYHQDMVSNPQVLWFHPRK